MICWRLVGDLRQALLLLSARDLCSYSLPMLSARVLYFCYWSPVADSTFLRGQAIMTPRIAPGSSAKPTIADQVPSQKYAIVKRLNAKLRVLGDCKHSTNVCGVTSSGMPKPES